jgi:hypothetical protein
MKKSKQKTKKIPKDFSLFFFLHEWLFELLLRTDAHLLPRRAGCDFHRAVRRGHDPRHCGGARYETYVC